jgi:hypothetical protein
MLICRCTSVSSTVRLGVYERQLPEQYAITLHGDARTLHALQSTQLTVLLAVFSAYGCCKICMRISNFGGS